MTLHPDGERPTSPRRRAGRRFAFLAFFVLACAMAAIGYQWLMISQEQRDRETIAFERSQRYVLASSGLSLPGSPDLSKLQARLAEQGLKQGAPVLVRIFKREFELELWMARDNRFERFATYPICSWSGSLGPKVKTGDYQAPEGFYSVARDQLNPNSKYYRSFNLGFPNAYDRSLGRTGSFLMVHGACASVGCYAMTDAQMGEIWQLVTAALQAGQSAFQVQVYPFRLSRDTLEPYRGHVHEAFWRNLAEGNDLFERTRLPPVVSLCDGRYGFAPGETTGSAGIGGSCAQASAKN